MNPVIEDRLPALETVELKHGAHDDFEQGACAMELVSYLAGEPFSDTPACASPVLGSFLRSWNDAIDDEGRQKLKPFLPRIIGTADDGQDEMRGWLAADWLVRVCTPAWLELAGITESATTLRGLPPLRDLDGLNAARPSIDKARNAGAAARAAARAAAGDAARAAAGDAARDAARAAAWDAAGDAAWDAARDAAWAAARAAARAAAWAAARDAAWDAARDAAWAAARDAARAAAWAAARDAAWDAARDAAWAAARAAAGDAAWDKPYGAAREAADENLEPTKLALQASALELLENMIDPSEASR